MERGVPRHAATRRRRHRLHPLALVIGVVAATTASGCSSRSCPPFPTPTPMPVDCGEPLVLEAGATRPLSASRLAAELEASPPPAPQGGPSSLRALGVDDPTTLDALGRQAAAIADAFRVETILALSGGAQNGAFGAGVLCAWRKRERIDFDVVTGVSTGALQAPFVFVGTDAAYAAMREGYLSAGVKDLVEMRPLYAVPFSSSLATADGLRRFVERYVTNRLIDQVAEDGRRTHRRLYVGTTNLDTGWLTAWDMVCLAQARQYDRFRLVLLASAHAPPLFPPVCIDGFLHGDGGIRQQLFVTTVVAAKEEAHRRRRRAALAALDGVKATPGPNKLDAVRKALEAVSDKPHVYFVVNGHLGTHAQCTGDDILAVAMRSVGLLAEEALIGTIWKAHGQLDLPGRFHLVSMPADAVIPGKGSMEYDRADMLRLFCRGESIGALPDPWMKHPCELPNVVHYGVCDRSAPCARRGNP